MNRLPFVALLLVAAVVPAYGQTADKAAKFHLDYNVPESPAFAALDLTPTNVMRAAAAKPTVVSLLGQIAQGERVPAGLALDVAPYAYARRFRNVSEYQNNYWKRFLANAVASVATVQAVDDTSSIAFAAGLRFTLRDDHDLLLDDTLTAAVSAMLVPEKIQCERVPGTNICKAGVRVDTVDVDLESVYDEVRERVSAKRGWAASVGAALGGRLQQGIPRPDSLQQRTGRAWLAASRYLGGRNELLGTVQWVRDTSRTEHLRAGAAFRWHSANSSLAAELAYDDQAGGILPGLNAEMRVLPRVTLVAALVTDPPNDDNRRKRLRFRTNLRWSATEGM